MAPPTRFRNVRFENRRAGVRRRLDIMAVMAVRAHRGSCVAVRNGLGVNAFLIRHEGTIADPGAVHHQGAAVTGAAGLCNVCSINRGFGITSWKDRRHIAAN